MTGKLLSPQHPWVAVSARDRMPPGRRPVSTAPMHTQALGPGPTVASPAATPATTLGAATVPRSDGRPGSETEGSRPGRLSPRVEPEGTMIMPETATGDVPGHLPLTLTLISPAIGPRAEDVTGTNGRPETTDLGMTGHLGMTDFEMTDGMTDFEMTDGMTDLKMTDV